MPFNMMADGRDWMCYRCFSKDNITSQGRCRSPHIRSEAKMKTPVRPLNARRSTGRYQCWYVSYRVHTTGALVKMHERLTSGHRLARVSCSELSLQGEGVGESIAGLGCLTRVLVKAL